MTFFKEGELKLLWPFYFTNFLAGMFFLLPIFEIPYFLNIGFSLAQIGMLTSAFALTAFLFEVPTGAIADLFGRKFSTILGIFTTGLIMFFGYFLNNFYSFLILFLLWGISITFVSGASEAWVVNFLKYKKKGELIKDFYSKDYFFGNSGFVVAGLIGAVIVGSYSIKIIWPISGVILMAQSLILLFIAKEHFIRKKAKVGEHILKMLEHTKKAIRYSFTHKTIRLITITSIIFVFAGSFGSGSIWFALLKLLNFQDNWFGYLSSTSALIGALISLFIPIIISRFKKQKNLLVILLIIDVLISSLAILANNFWFVSTLIILSSLVGMGLSLVVNPFIQKFIPNNIRATVISFRSMLTALVAIISVPLGGFVADIIGPKYSIFISAIITIPSIILYSRIKEN